MEDALSEEYFEARKADIKKRVSEKRFAHVCGVAQCAKELAHTYGVDEQKAHLAGILHDWDKNYDDEEIRERVKELNMDIDPFVLKTLARVLHAHTAAVALGREFPEIPKDVLQAIDRHTIAATDMTDLDMVVYCADALEPGRQFGRVDEIRDKIGKVELEELFLSVYEYWVELMLERRCVVHPITLEVWNHYAARWREKKGILEWKKM